MCCLCVPYTRTCWSNEDVHTKSWGLSPEHSQNKLHFSSISNILQSLQEIILYDLFVWHFLLSKYNWHKIHYLLYFTDISTFEKRQKVERNDFSSSVVRFHRNRFLHFSFPGWKLSTASCRVSAASPQARLLSDDSNNTSPSLQMEHFDGLCSVNLHRTEHIWINVDLRYTERCSHHVKVIHNCMQMLCNSKL